LIVLEATGRLEGAAAAGLLAAGLPVAIVNAAQVRNFALALNRRAKTDALDAAVIARFAEAVKPAVRPLPDAETAALEARVTRRRQVLRMRAGEQQRLHQTTDKPMRQSIARMIEALTEEIDRLDAEIDKAIRASPVWRVREDLMASVPGVGKLTARTLMAEMPELGSLSPKAAASLAGLAPFTRQSGQWKGKSFTGGGRASVRTALFMAALAAKKHNPALARTYDRLLAAGKPKMVALIAVARKLLTILDAIIRDEKQWEQA
jgi:transposase